MGLLWGSSLVRVVNEKRKRGKMCGSCLGYMFEYFYRLDEASLKTLSLKSINPDGKGDSERAQTRKSLNCHNDEPPTHNESEVK
jgi:hypothetical protein